MGDTGAAENLTRRAEIESRSDSASLVFPGRSTRDASHTGSNFCRKRDFFGGPPGASHHPNYF